MTENCSNVGTFTALLDKAFYIGIILEKKLNLLLSTDEKIFPKRLLCPLVIREIIKHALRNMYIHQTVYKLEKDK